MKCFNVLVVMLTYILQGYPDISVIVNDEPYLFLVLGEVYNIQKHNSV